mgnify:CR=1 FL=1
MAAFTVIEHQELGASAATITFASIPSSYDHLYLTGSVRTDESTYTSLVNWAFNNDTAGGNYSYTLLRAYSATPNSYRQSTSDGGGRLALIAAGASVLADTFGTFTAWIPYYANTANFKQVLISAAQENNSTTDSQWRIAQWALLWHATAAVSEIDLTVNSGDDFVQYSNLTLYGVTGA